MTPKNKVCVRGGDFFRLPDDARIELCRLKGVSPGSPETVRDYGAFAIEETLPRHDPDLIKVVEEYEACDLFCEKIQGTHYLIIEHERGDEVITPETHPYVVIS